MSDIEADEVYMSVHKVQSKLNYIGNTLNAALQALEAGDSNTALWHLRATERRLEESHDVAADELDVWYRLMTGEQYDAIKSELTARGVEDE